MNSTSCSSCGAKDVGLMIIRVGVGACFIAHGLSKIHLDQPQWGLAMMGGAVEYLGIHSHFAMWGLLNVLAEAGGGVLLVLGFLVRPAAFAMALNMIVAINFHLHSTIPHMNEFAMWSHALEDGIVFLGLLLAGGGGCSMDAKLFGHTALPALRDPPKM